MEIDIGRFLAKRALLDGARPALIADGRRMNFAELEAEAARAAAALHRFGVRRGDRVAVLLRNGLHYVTLYYAAAKLGAILCGINWRLAAPEIGYIMADAEPALLVHDMEFAPAVDAAASSVPAFAVGVGAESRRPFADLVGAAPPSGAAQPFDGAGPGDPDAALVLVYTSGTTGRPKGAVLTHRQMYWASATMAASHDYKRGDVNLVPTPLFHVGGLSFTTLFVHLGATLLLPRAFDPGVVLRAVAEERVAHFFAVPAMLRALADHPEFATADLSGLRWILCGGAPVPDSLVDLFGVRGVPVLQTYGSTETAGPATMMDHSHAGKKPGSAGLPYFHTEIRIADGRGGEAPPGEAGEVQVRAPHVFAGYWRNPEATAAAFDGPWLKMGDVGRRDAEGYLYVVDRIKDVVISGGENIYPAEIEAVLADHPAITEVAVVGAPDREWGEVPCAVVLPKPGATLTLEDVLAFCKGKLARYKLPRRLVLRDAPLPRNATGKVLKGELRKAL